MNRAERRKTAKQGKVTAVTGMQSTATISETQLLQHALQLHQANRLSEAEVAYRQVLATNPNQPDALHLLGVLASQVGHHATGAELVLKSIQLRPNSLESYYNLARIYQAEQNISGAEQALRMALHYAPNDGNLLYQIGALCCLQSKYEEATTCFTHAASYGKALLPKLELGMMLKSLQRLEDAAHILESAHREAPTNFDVLHELVHVLDALKHSAQADPYYAKAFTLAQALPPSVSVHTFLGAYYNRNNKCDDAVVHLKAAVALQPESAELLSNLATAYKNTQHLEEAITLYQRALALNPSLWGTYLNLGGLLRGQARFKEAIAVYQKALELMPQSVDILVQLGTTYGENGQADTALDYLQRAIAIDSSHAEAHIALGFIASSKGEIQNALTHYKRAFETEKGHAEAHSNYLFAMHYDSTATPEAIAQESRVWGKRYADNVVMLAHNNTPDPNKRLRVGYISADFYRHVVANYFEPVLASHDPKQVEVFCYANQTNQDEVTARLQSYAQHWRNIHALSDDVVAQLIQQDAIDILIDLSGHTAHHRLQVFARKPAPIQITWIGYFNTTGMKAMDYIIADKYLLPDEEKILYTEKPLYLPNSRAVYAAHDLPVTVNELPALTRGYVTFGCFNALSKLTPQTIECWIKLLKRIPEARLLLKNKSFDDKDTCARYLNLFTHQNIAAERVQFSGHSPTIEYLKAYHEIDIALDPFPYNGATTTFDGFWMGVPIIARKGNNLVSHIGESLLGSVGLEEYIAQDDEEYIAKAMNLAADLSRLSAIRQNLRAKLEAAPIANPSLFTRGLESAFRDIWKVWCQQRTQQ